MADVSSEAIPHSDQADIADASQCREAPHERDPFRHTGFIAPMPSYRWWRFFLPEVSEVLYLQPGSQPSPDDLENPAAKLAQAMHSDE
ncbi:MAG: hypothetical protein ACR2OE_16315 [Thermomicrobiales bacterium]